MHTRRERIDRGCVMRALESGFKVKATDEEWNFRLDVLDEMEKMIRRLSGQVSNSLQSNELERNIFRLEHKYLIDLLNIYSQHQTPLGEALRRYTIKNIILPTPQVIRYVVTRGIIVFSDRIPGYPGHMAHIGWKNRLVMLSDHNFVVPKQGPKDNFSLFVFTPK